MWLALETVFNELEEEKGFPYCRQGSYGADEQIPQSFFTFWNSGSEFDEYYDEKPTRCIWTWNIFFYTNDASQLYVGLEHFIEKAQEKGFLIKGKGKDLQCDEPNYYGRYCTVEFIEYLDDTL